MIKPQQLSRYLLLQGWSIQEGLPYGKLAWRSQAPGTDREFSVASPTCSTLAPPRPAPCKSPMSLIYIHTSSFPYPPALGGWSATGLPDSSPFCFHMSSRELLLHP